MRLTSGGLSAAPPRPWAEPNRKETRYHRLLWVGTRLEETTIRNPSRPIGNTFCNSHATSGPRLRFCQRHRSSCFGYTSFPRSYLQLPQTD